MKNLQTAVVATAFAASVALGAATPARADGAASTRNILIGLGALAAGAVIETNVAHKRSAATRVRGYTRDGSTVYADGRIVRRDGRSFYPGNYGESIDCNGYRCYVTR